MRGNGFAIVAVLMLAGCSDPSPPEKPGPTAKADMITFYHAMTGAIASCDSAGALVSTAASLGDPVAVYRAAEKMESACLGVPGDLRGITVPLSVGKKSYDELVKTQKACENAYVMKWSAAGTMKKALDNMGSVSARAELTEATEAMGTGTMVCAAGLVSEAVALGVSEAELGIGKK